MRGEDHAIVEHPFRIGQPACAQGAVRPKVTVCDGNLPQRPPSALPVLDPLGAGPGGLARSRIRLPFAPYDLQQLAALYPRQYFRVEKLSEFRDSYSLNGGPHHG
jgi:hypothetical protein